MRWAESIDGVEEEGHVMALGLELLKLLFEEVGIGYSVVLVEYDQPSVIGHSRHAAQVVDDVLPVHAREYADRHSLGAEPVEYLECEGGLSRPRFTLDEERLRHSALVEPLKLQGQAVVNFHHLMPSGILGTLMYY